LHLFADRIPPTEEEPLVHRILFVDGSGESADEMMCTFRLFRTIPVGESVRLMVGASAFNALNHPNFSQPGSDVASQGLGLVTSTAVNPSGPFGSAQSGLSGRVVVVTGKLTF
jgi:hypothetical protein